eukprot:scaffold13000_cov105-Skeletonema_marinoi.AAC.1
MMYTDDLARYPIAPAGTRNLNRNLQFKLLLANQHDHHDQESDEYMSSIFLLNPEIEIWMNVRTTCSSWQADS